MIEKAISSDEKEAFDLYILRTKADIESSLLELSSTLSEFKVQKRVQDAIFPAGKRLRPILAVLSGEAVGGNRKDLIPLSVAFELMHTATLIHDDIIDEDEIRRDKPALHKKWSITDAILTGDALIALAVEISSKYGEEVLKNVARSAFDLCEGELWDCAFNLDEVNEELYFKTIKQKSASLFKSVCFCGAFVGKGSNSEIDALSSFGENFGTAYQLKDDLLDLISFEGPIPSDLMKVRLTFPLVLLISREGSTHNSLKMDLESLRLEEPKIGAFERIQESLEKGYILDRCKIKTDEYIQKSIESIAPLDDGEFKSRLVQLAGSLKVR